MSTHYPSLEDPATLEVMWSRLVNITEECWVTIWRTAFSMIVGEAQDFGCELLDREGRSLAHAPRSMPVFNLTLARAVRSLLSRFPPDTLHDGDVLATNDPWICAGHLYDVALVTPVFRSGGLIGFVGSIAHCTDVGGSRDPLSVREIYEEGIVIPPMLLYKAGEPNREVLDLLARNVRTSDLVMGDLEAQLASNRVGAARLLDFMDEYGLDDLSALAKVIQDRTDTAMREAILAVPDGIYQHSVEGDATGGGRFRLNASIKVEADEIFVDWPSAPPQVEVGGINCTLSYTAAHTVYALKCLLTPDVPSNDGCFRAMHVSAPEGSVLNCTWPAAVNARTMVGWYCAPAVFGALAPALPDRVQGFTGMPMGMGAYGTDPQRGVFNDHLFQGGGQGAGASGDGKSALLFPTSAGNTAVEMFEVRTPLLVEAKEFIVDSGGPGQSRGGLGQRVRVRKLRDDDRPALMTLHPQGIRTQVPGPFGGHAGRRAAIRVENGTTVREGPDLGGLAELRRSAETLTLELGGGSGYGDSRQRPVDLVRRDYRAGLVSADGLESYGCSLDADGDVVRRDA